MLNSKLLLYIGRNSITFTFLILLLLFIITKKQHIIFLLILLICSEMLNSFFKNISERIMKNNNFPIIGKGTRPLPKLKSYGMPSGHSQYMATFSTFLVLLIYNSNTINKNHKIIYYIVLSLMTIYVMYERVYEKFHTIQQTIVGMFIGILIGFIGFNIYVSF